MELTHKLERLAGGVFALTMLEVPAVLASEGAACADDALRASVQSSAGEDAAAPPPEPASAEAVQRLLARFDEAARANDAEAWIVALEAMAQHPNDEFVPPALAALKYRAGKADKAAAKSQADELGQKDAKAVELLLALAESKVHAAGARVLALHADPKVGKALLGAFQTKGLCSAKPLAAAAIVDALGRSGYRAAEEAVLEEFTRRGEVEVQRACVRYFGQIKTTSFEAVRILCEELAAPEPAAPDTAANPPASYWEERWKAWQHVRRDVSWALREITGQTFQPAEGGGEGDSKRALDYVKERRRELGLK